MNLLSTSNEHAENTEPSGGRSQNVEEPCEVLEQSFASLLTLPTHLDVVLGD